MGRDVAGAHVPFLDAIAVEAIQAPGRNVVLGIGDIDILGDGIDRYGIGDDDFPA